MLHMKVAFERRAVFMVVGSPLPLPSMAGDQVRWDLFSPLPRQALEKCGHMGAVVDALRGDLHMHDLLQRPQGQCL